MFKVPDWGDDVPNIKVNFDKKSKKKDKNTAPPPKSPKTEIKQLQNNSFKNSPQNGINKKKRKNKQQNQGNTKVTEFEKEKKVKYVQKTVKWEEKKQQIGNNNKSPNKVKSSINTGTNVSLSKKAKLVNKKLDRIKKKPQIVHNTENINQKSIPNELDQNVPKKGKKRKKPISSNVDNANNFHNDDNKKAKKIKLDDNLTIDDTEDLLFAHNNKSKNKKIKKKPIGEKKLNSKKDRLKQLLETQIKRTPIKTSGNKLRDRMLERLKAAQFRYINEKLYTSSGSDAQQLFQNDPAAFHTYHEGYQLQVKKWPVNPLDVIVKRIKKIPKTNTIADMGCGEAALSKRIPHTVRSFDLVATGPGVEVCDIAHTPLLSASMDVTVYCLALMGTDLTQYLVEANRVLKTGGLLLIAEVESRFEKVEDFVKDVERLGFKLKNLDKTHQVFFFMEFSKVKDSPVKKSKLRVLTLKPCLYKRR